MKIFLTGGSGQVGTELQRRARSAGVEFVAPTRARLDLSDRPAMAAALVAAQPDIVFSVGAYTAVDKAEDEPELAFAINGGAVEAMAEYCASAGKPLFHLSTDYVFDGMKTGPYLETDPTGPIGIYGRSKLAGEQAAARAPQHLVLRTSWVFAAHGANFVKTMLRVGRDRPELRVVADQVGGPTWAGHIAEALLTLAARWQRQGTLPWGVYHYSGAPALSWHGFATAIFDQAVTAGLLERAPQLHAITTADYPTKARRPANSCLDMTITGQQLDLPPPDWRRGLDAVLQELARQA